MSFFKNLFSSKKRTKEAKMEDIQHGDYDPHRTNVPAGYGSQLPANYSNYPSNTMYPTQQYQSSTMYPAQQYQSTNFATTNTEHVVVEDDYDRRHTTNDKHNKHGKRDKHAKHDQTTSAKMYDDNKMRKQQAQVIVPPGPVIVPAVVIPITTPAQQMPQQQMMPPQPAPLPPQEEVLVKETIIKETEVIPPPPIQSSMQAPIPVQQRPIELNKSGLYTNNYPHQPFMPPYPPVERAAGPLLPAQPLEVLPQPPQKQVIVEKEIEIIQPQQMQPLPPQQLQPLPPQQVEILPPREEILPPPPPPLVESMPPQPMPPQQMQGPVEIMAPGSQVLQPVNNYTGVKFETPQIYTEQLAPVPLPEAAAPQQMMGPPQTLPPQEILLPQQVLPPQQMMGGQQNLPTQQPMGSQQIRAAEIMTQDRELLQDSVPLSQGMMARPPSGQILASGNLENQQRTTTVVEKRKIIAAPSEGFTAGGAPGQPPMEHLVEQKIIPQPSAPGQMALPVQPQIIDQPIMTERQRMNFSQGGQLQQGQFIQQPQGQFASGPLPPQEQSIHREEQFIQRQEQFIPRQEQFVQRQGQFIPPQEQFIQRQEQFNPRQEQIIQELPPAPIEQPIFDRPPTTIMNSGRPRENIVITDSKPPAEFLPSQSGQYSGQGVVIGSNLAPNAMPGPEIGLNPGADFLARNRSTLPQNSLQNPPIGTGHLTRIVEYDGSNVIANDAIFPRDKIIGPATWSNPNFAANYQNLRNDPEYISRHLAENNPAKPKPFHQMQQYGKIPNPSYAGGKPFFVDMLYNPDPIIPLDQYGEGHLEVPLPVIAQKNAELIQIQKMNEQVMAERKAMMRDERQF